MSVGRHPERRYPLRTLSPEWYPAVTAKVAPKVRAQRRLPESPSGRQVAAICLGLVVLVLVLYGGTSSHDFVSLDDEEYVTENPYVRNGLTSAGVRWAFSTTYEGNWHPLTWVSHMVDVSLFGMRPGPHHLASVAFHALNGALLFLALRATGKLLWEKVPLLVLSGASSTITYLAQKSAGVVNRFDVIPLGTRLAGAAVSYFSYLWKTLWPANLSVYYTLRKLPPGTGPLVGALLLAVSAWIVFAGLRGRPWLAVGWLWYLGTLVPVIGIVQVGRQAMADRYTYLPHVGIFLAVAWSLREVLARRPSARPVVIAAAACALLASTAATWAQIEVWRNSRTLFEHALRLDPENFLAHNGLGVVLVREGDLKGALRHLESAVREAPDYVHARNNLAGALAREGRYEEAAEHLRKALRMMPDDATAHFNLGLVLENLGRLEESAVHYREALRLEPGLADARAGLARIGARTSAPAGP